MADEIKVLLIAVLLTFVAAMTYIVATTSVKTQCYEAAKFNANIKCS